MPVAQNESRDLVSLNTVPFWGVFGKIGNWRPEILKASARSWDQKRVNPRRTRKMKNRD